MREHYVYIHRKASDGAIFYVGKGRRDRAWSRYSRNRHWRFVAEKHGHTVEILRDGLSEACALALERIAIARIGLSNLANMVDGGGGTTGWKHSDEARRKIGAAFKGRKLTDRQRAALDATRGRPFSDEQRHKMSLAAKLRTGRTVSAETRAKIAASHIGIKPSAETLAKMSAAKIGKACGRDSPSYDHTIHTFSHVDHPDFAGTRAEFIAAFSLGDSCVSAVIRGRQKSVKGWRLK